MSIKKFAFIAAIAIGTVLPISTYMPPPVSAESQSTKKFMKYAAYVGSPLVFKEAVKVILDGMKATCNLTGTCDALKNIAKANDAVTEDTPVEDMAESIVEAAGDDAAGDVAMAELGTQLVAETAVD